MGLGLMMMGVSLSVSADGVPFTNVLLISLHGAKVYRSAILTFNLSS